MAYLLRGGLVLVLVSLLGSTAACDKEPPTAAPPPKASSAPPAAPPSAAPAAPTKPQLAIDDSAAFVAGERLEIGGPAPKDRIKGALDGKLVEGEVLVLNAARDTKMPKVAAMIAALMASKAKGLEIHTPLRDRSLGELAFSLGVKPADCSAVGFIAKDSTISTWTIAGANAERFTHGMAGPDLTRGSEGIRKRVLACDASPVWFVSADDSVTWGLVFDMALAVMRPEDAGLPKARSVAVLLKPPVPGRKVAADALE
jgi:hypothetical protein